MKIALTLLLWILIRDRIGHSVTGRSCTFSASNDHRGVQLIINCGSITCHFNECSDIAFPPFTLSTTCHFSNCTEDQLPLCQCQEELSTICPERTIPEACLGALRNNPSIQQKICSDSPTSRSSSSDMCNSRPTDSEMSIMISASPKSTYSLSSIMNKSPTSTNSVPSSIMNKAGQSGESVIVTSLGVLVGILLVLLVVVITGWVWTCLTMKQRERNKTNSKQVRTIQNTAYGVILPTNNSSAGQQVSSNTEQLGNTSQAGGLQGRAIENNYYLTGNDLEGGEEHEYHVLEGPGGDEHVHQNREVVMREVKESGEEHEYHVLEGPGGDDASREPGWREVDGAMDYEIPLPLKNK